MTTVAPARLVLGTRGSGLALAQADLAAAALSKALPGVEIAIRRITTSGDQKLDLSLIKQTPAGAKGLFTKELEEALRSREIDIAVHSCKDMPGTMPPGLTLAAVLRRGHPEDVFLSATAPTLAALPPGARVGTSSVRRARQLLWKRPDLGVEEIRGNVQTRLRKLRDSGTLAGTILARAGLERLGFRPDEGRIEFENAVFRAEILDFLPAIGQAAIALQTRTGDDPARAAAQAVNHLPTWVAVRAERELMRLLNGDCQLPVGVSTTQEGERLRMEVILFGEAGEPRLASAEGPANAPEALAAAAFAQIVG